MTLAPIFVVSALGFGQGALDGDGQKIVDGVGEEPADEEGYEDEEEGAYQAAAQLVQMLKKRHLSAEFFIVSALLRPCF